MPETLELAPSLQMGDAVIRTGTCSWTDQTLVKETSWYPKKSMTAAERLAYYAAQFPVVEADSTYYRPPSPELTRSWVERTPPGFVMNVKAYSLLTGHPTKPETLWPDILDALDPEVAAKKNVYPQHLPDEAMDEVWLRFQNALEPLQEAGKLGAVLFQYPVWFTPKRANREALAQVRERLEDMRICVEFRSPTWLEEDDRGRTLDVLTDNELALVVVDAPAVSHLPTVPVATSDLAVVRFHGRADDTWKVRTSSAAERFKYLYDENEIEQWVPHVRELAQQAQEVHLLMNNCYQDYGVRNAADLRNALLDAGAEETAE
jgi:uncharacterized protein YecE (DUF72 family)